MKLGSGRRLLFERFFLCLLATNFVLGLTSAFVVPFVSLWATREVGMSSLGLGAFMTVSALSAIALSQWIARGSDSHVPRRRLILLGAAAGVVGNTAYAFVRDPYVLTAIGATVLALASINFAQFFAHVREEIGRAEHGGADAPFLMGVLRACYALAWTVGPPIGAQVLVRFGYQGVFLATAALYAVFGAAVHRFVAERPRAAAGASPEADASALRAGGWGLGEPVLWAYALAFGLVFAGFTLKALNLPLFLTEKLGSDEQAVGLAFAVSPLFELAFMVGFGHLAAKGSRYERAVIGCGVASAVAYFLALRSVSAAWQVYPLQVLNAAAVAVTTSVAIPFFQDLMPQRAGAATSLYSNALKLGSLLGFVTFGTLASRAGHTGLFAICAGLSAVSLGVVVLVRPAARVQAPGRGAVQDLG